MTSILLPDSEAEIEAIVGEAAATKTPLAIHGGGSRDIGRPVQAARVLSTKAMTGVTLYEPAELVLSARAGTPLAEIETLLAAHRQRLAFEPIDWRPLLGTVGEPTIGGVTASNASGPRRIQAGAARDHLIGIRATTGRGETVKSGGRVMKNVTGYDFVKLFAGSWGTLGILTEVTYKLLPQAETESTLIFEGLDDRRGVEAMTTALGTPFEITGAAHLPGAPSRTALRFEGFAMSCDYRTERLRALLADFGDAEVLRDAASAALWRDIRDLAPLAVGEGECVWRISVKPTDGPLLAERLRDLIELRVVYDWSGGLVFAATPAMADGGAGAIRNAVAALGGHATLVKAPLPLRAAIPVFQAEAPAMAAMAQKVREAFDPAGVLNPGRMG